LLRLFDPLSAYGGVKKTSGGIPKCTGIAFRYCRLGTGWETAKGRWYGFAFLAQRREGENRALIGCGIWENEYIKEKGTWKFLKLCFSEIFC